MAVQGSSDFTAAGLGQVDSSKYYMNTLLTDSDATTALLQWYDEIWNNPVAVAEAKGELIRQLSILTEEKSPAFIYFLTLYNLFKDFLADLDEENIIKTKTGFKDTLVWKMLYKFQKDGVLGAIDKLEKYNGCIIADSVGLGKTFEALAVIKYYELRNDRVLVLCPKKLRENWTIYTVNDKRNILSADRFNFDVLNHTDLTRLQGQSGEINLETLNWGNYDLIVIDESHNFRNNPPRKKGTTRYARMMEDIIRSGVKTRVLMLSATPVNSRMNDLKNQVAFITEGNDTAYFDMGIRSIEETLRKAQTRFNRWLEMDPVERNLEDLLESMNFDYFKLLDMLTIARSRKHIEKYYDIKEIGEFPERKRPLNIKEDIDLEEHYPPLSEINRTIKKLNLAAYAPLKYVRMDKRAEYSRKYDMQVKGGSVFKQVDREENLIHLMRINLLKRMESSINSFSLTVDKLLHKVDDLVDRIDQKDDTGLEDMNIEDIEVDDPEFDDFLIGTKVKVLFQDIDVIRWKQDLDDDREKLVVLLRESQAITAERDKKLHRLKAMIAKKSDQPLNDGNNKVIVFTAFADTAEYLYKNIADWISSRMGLYTALVTGSRTNQTNCPDIRNDVNSILTAFSPISKERRKIDDTATNEIDVLIATDCISEGQNLQDCDYLINYDIHWNPVRIIQRFGRIDRLGSKNKTVQLVNFWPNMELDEYINLEARVSGRMVLLDISATGEENLIDPRGKKKMNDLEYRRKQLQQLQDNVVDLEDMSGGVSITDMTLNDFRMDLSEYMKGHLGILEQAPVGLYAVTALEDELAALDLEPGAIFCLKNVGEPTNVGDSYALAPHYLVYVTDDGQVKHNFLHAKKILDVLKKQGLGQNLPDEQAVDLFLEDTDQGRNMAHYRELLDVAVGSVVGKKEEKGGESLFQRGGTTLTSSGFQGMRDIEVICYLIIK